MKLRTFLIGIALPTCAAFGASPQAVELRYAPDAEQLLRKQWVTHQVLRPAVAYHSVAGRRQEQELNLTLDATQLLTTVEPSQAAAPSSSRRASGLVAGLTPDILPTPTTVDIDRSTEPDTVEGRRGAG